MSSEPDPQTTPATRSLDESGIPFRLFQHPGAIHSLEQAAQERGQEPGQVVRSLLFRLDEGDFLMVLMAGPTQVSWPALRRYLGVRRLTTADAEEVLAVTGYRPGTVSPFGLKQPVRTLVDQSVLVFPEVSLGSGRPGLAILMDPQDLMRALVDAEIGQFGEIKKE